jgi:hypothetical protein
MTEPIDLPGDEALARVINLHRVAALYLKQHRAAVPNWDDRDEAAHQALHRIASKTFEFVRGVTPRTSGGFLEKARTLLADDAAGDYLDEARECLDAYERGERFRGAILISEAAE